MFSNGCLQESHKRFSSSLLEGCDFPSTLVSLSFSPMILAKMAGGRHTACLLGFDFSPSKSPGGRKGTNCQAPLHLGAGMGGGGGGVLTSLLPSVGAIVAPCLRTELIGEKKEKINSVSSGLFSSSLLFSPKLDLQPACSTGLFQGASKNDS